VCTDQRNIAERNHQVQLMRRVYTQAKEVLIWLDGEDEDTEVALRLAAYIDVTQQQQGPVNEELFRIINDAAMTFSMSPSAANL
jgi:Heterokaryon incompatibility protein (HET)